MFARMLAFLVYPIFMNIKRSIIHRANDSKQTQKAVALALYCKDKLNVNYIDEFSYNKLHVLTGLHDTTLRKRIKTLLSMGVAFFQKNFEATLLLKYFMLKQAPLSKIGSILFYAKKSGTK